MFHPERFWKGTDPTLSIGKMVRKCYHCALEQGHCLWKPFSGLPVYDCECKVPCVPSANVCGCTSVKQVIAGKEHAGSANLDLKKQKSKCRIVYVES